MAKHALVAGALALALVTQPISQAAASVYAVQTLASGSQSGMLELAQWGPPGSPGHRPHGPPPRVYHGWRGEPGWRGAPAWRGPKGWAGKPYWYGRPWVRRPYYGTIFAGVALGTLVTVAAIGYVPPRPHPSLCWYWADPYGERGYWDYC